MFVALAIAAMAKDNEPKVHFYIKRVCAGLELWMRDNRGVYSYIRYMEFGDDYLVDTESFRSMGYDEMREVNLMED